MSNLFITVCKYDSVVLIFHVKVMTSVSLYMKLNTDKTKIRSTMLTMYYSNEYVRRPRTDPWGTPESTSKGVIYLLWIQTKHNPVM